MPTIYGKNKIMNIDEFNLYEIFIGRRYYNNNIRIWYKGDYYNHTLKPGPVGPYNNCNSHSQYYMIVQRDFKEIHRAKDNMIDCIAIISVY